MILSLHSYNSDNHHFEEKSICLKAVAKSQPFPQPSMAHRLLLRALTQTPFNQFSFPSLAFLALLGAKSHLREPFLWEAQGNVVAL